MTTPLYRVLGSKIARRVNAVVSRPPPPLLKLSWSGLAPLLYLWIFSDRSLTQRDTFLDDVFLIFWRLFIFSSFKLLLYFYCLDKSFIRL